MRIEIKPEGIQELLEYRFGPQPEVVGKVVADYVNERIRQYLERSPRVFMAKGRGHFDAWTINGSDLDASPTHTGVLVNIEETSK